MTFRDRMRVSPSKAEQTLLIELQKRGLAKKLYPLGSVIVFVEGYKIVELERFTKTMLKEANELREIADQANTPVFTQPDFIFQHNPPLPVYLDGPVHKRKGVQNRDSKINEQLCQCGIPPLRFPYSPPLSGRRLMQIVNKIEEQLKQ